MRNFNAVATDDSGSVAALYGIRNYYGHDNTNVSAAPTTTTVFGLSLVPYITTGTIGNLYDLYIATPVTGGTISGSHYAIYQADASAINYFAGSVGIGINPVSAQLHVYDSNSGFLYGIKNDYTNTDVAGSGIYNLVTTRKSTTVAGSTVGLNLIHKVQVDTGIVNTSNIYGIASSTLRNDLSVGTDDSGAVSIIYGTRNYYGHDNVNVSATPTTTTAYGIHLSPQAKTGTIGNLYDIYIATPATGGTISGTHFAIYQQDANADNFFAGKLGIGNSSLTGYTLKVTGGLDDASVVSGIASVGTVKTATPTSAYMFNSSPVIDSTATSMATMIGYNAGQSTYSVTPTSNIGFNVATSMIGGTNNYGFYSQIAAGTGRWNFYASGTALNYFAGNILRSQPTPSTADSTATITVAQIATRIITSTTAAAVSMTLPTGTLTDIGFQTPPNDASHDWTVINTGATNAVTILAGVAHTVVGNMTVALSSSATFRTRKTASNTYVTYRI
jgi:hypothetical protein